MSTRFLQRMINFVDRVVDSPGPDLYRKDMTGESAFRLDYDDAVLIYDELESRLAEEHGGVTFIHVRAGLGDAAGVTRVDKDGEATIEIACPEVIAGSSVRHIANGYVDGRTVVDYFVTACHEANHVDQFHGMRSFTYDASLALLLVCSQGNRLWYDDKSKKSNKWHNPLEIESEKNGLTGCYRFLCDSFPGVDSRICELAVLDHVERHGFHLDEDGNRLRRRPYYIQLPMDWNKDSASLADVKKLFDDAYASALDTPMSYGRRKACVDKEDDDVVRQSLYTDSGSCRIASPWMIARKALSACSDLKSSLVIMGSITLLNYPRFYEIYPCLEKMRAGLDLDAVFGGGFRDRVYAYDRKHNPGLPYVKRELLIIGGKALIGQDGPDNGNDGPNGPR